VIELGQSIMNVLSKAKIREIAMRYRDSDPDVAALTAMADEQRKVSRKSR